MKHKDYKLLPAKLCAEDMTTCCILWVFTEMSDYCIYYHYCLFNIHQSLVL